MKKNVVSVALIVLLAVGVAAAWFLARSSRAGASRLAECLPADTALFLHLPDARRTRERWPKTALAQIAAEPEVQAFLERPKSRLPKAAEWRRQMERIARIDPGEAFLAVMPAAGGGTIPKAVAGFSFHGKKEDAAALLADLRGAAQREWPAGKSDIVQSGADEIETFTFQNNTLATAVRKDWALVGSDVALLQATLARLDGKRDAAGADSLKGNAAFSKSLERMPREPDVLAFVQMRALAEPLASLFATLNPGGDARQLDELKKIESFALGAKLEGENIRDAIFMLKPGEPEQAAMRRNSLALTSPDTLAYHAGALGALPEMPVLPSGTAAALGGLQSFSDAFAAAGLTGADFARAFGPEAGLVADWPAGTAAPAVVFALDVRDAEIARRFLTAGTQSAGGAAAWKSETVDGGVFMHFPQTVFGMFPLDFTLTQTEKFVLAGLNLDAVQRAAARVKSGGATLAKSPGYQQAAGMVHEPTGAFTYVDSRAAFERLYGLLRPYVMLGAAFAAPGASDYVDVSRLPAPETIGRHLRPIVYSQAVVENGVLSESVGPVTYSQAAAFALAGAAVAGFQKALGASGAGAGFTAPPALPGPGRSGPPGWKSRAVKAPPAPAASASP